MFHNCAEIGDIYYWLLDAHLRAVEVTDRLLLRGGDKIKVRNILLAEKGDVALDVEQL